MDSDFDIIRMADDLRRRGYSLDHDRSGRMKITEPAKRFLPQSEVGIATMREAMVWASAVEHMRMILTHNRPPKEPSDD